ncbi:MAG: 2-hydroxyacyl-CoA dehydratase [Chloroflexi bacterium]|nr:2-hydroxyacyl-CoA dehydratase [Chloroflexota bacterium]
MFLQEQIQNLQRRLKNIAENPRPEYLQSTRLRYEVELENYLAVIESWKNGKPFAILEGMEQLISPMGFEHQSYIEWGDRVRDPQKYLNIAVSKCGFPEHTCDRTMTALGLLLSGEVPIPRLMTGRRGACDPERWSATAAAKYTGTLFMGMARVQSIDYEGIHCWAEHATELIEFAEKSIPGIHFDEEKLVELLAMDQKAVDYMRDSYRLRERVPCPISPQDSFRLSSKPSRFSNPEKYLQYCQAYHDEVFERAEKGIGGVPEEKLRIAWLATGPFGRSTFDLLTRKGVSIPWFHYGTSPFYFGLIHNDYGDDSTYGRKLTPLEEMGRYINANAWGSTGELWVDSLVRACRELKIDAVVDFLQVGCITTKNLKRITAQSLKEELGIPTLDLEGREFFASEVSMVEMNKRLEEFLDMCIANKK